MANGTIAFDTLTTSGQIKGGTEKSINTDFALYGTNKAWFWAFNFAQADDSFNVSSITDDATGKCSPQFTNHFANDDYACAGTSSDGDGILNLDRDLQTTSSIQNTHFGDLQGSGSFNDATFGMVYCGALA